MRHQTTSHTGRFALASMAAAFALLAPPADAQNTPIANPFPTPIPQDGARVRLVPVAAGMTAPLRGVMAPGVTDRMFVVDQIGYLWSMDLSTGTHSVFLDVRSRMIAVGLGGPGSYDERGFLGVAFHPNFATNGLFYTFESRPVAGNTPDFTTLPANIPANCHSTITEWRAEVPFGKSGVDLSSAREIIRIAKPQFNHNGGEIDFGRDGFLYVSLGDGGQADDQGNGHNPVTGNGQDTSVILGKIVRIDVNTRNSANGKYGIPAGNPFSGVGGLGEIYAYGFRNPWRFTFDRLTGDLWIGDVGQNSIEEINVVTLGGNYGWRMKEGTFLFDPNGNGNGFVYQDSPGSPAGLLDPVAQYDHDEGLAVVTGFVYRGGRNPALYGHLVFGDWARVFTGTSPGRLFQLDAANTIHELRYAGTPFNIRPLGFGEDAGGNIYVMGNITGTPVEFSGAVLRIDNPCPADVNLDGAIDPADVASFVNTWTLAVASSTPDADFDGDGTVGPADIAAFVNAWFVALFAGC